MKVIILGPAHPYRGGIGAVNMRLATEYQNNNNDVEIYNFTLMYPSIFFPGKTQYSDEPAPSHLQICRKVHSCNPFNWIKVGNEIKKKRPDLLIIAYWLPLIGPCLGSIARIVRQNHHTQVVSLLHNIVPHEKRIGDRLFSQYLVGGSDGFITMSQSVSDDLATFDTQKPRALTYHPLFDHYGTLISKDKACNILNLDPSKKYILFFGFIRKYKGLDMLFDAMKQQMMVDQDIHLIVAGEYYGDPTPYEDQIKRNNIADRVHLFTDFIPDGQVNRYFSASDLVVLPYHSATQSGVTQIAFQFEKPMLVTNVGGLPEIVPHGKCGTVVEPQPEAIAEGIVDFFQNNRNEAYTQGVRKEKQKYSWTRLMESFNNVMQQSSSLKKK